MCRADETKVSCIDVFLIYTELISIFFLCKESMADHQKIWEDWCDGYLLELLDQSLNHVPRPPKDFSEMTESEFNLWLSKVDLNNDAPDNLYKISPPCKQERCRSFQVSKTDVINLELSLEDNSTLTGTASILEKFAEEFSIPCPSTLDIPFNTARKSFDIVAARTQYEFVKSVEIHKVEMNEIVKQINSYEKEFDFGLTKEHPFDNGSESSGDEVDNANAPLLNNDVERVTLEVFFSKTLQLTREAVYSEDDNAFDNLVHQLSKESDRINALTDKYGRNVFHLAVEGKQYTLVKVLVSIGINPNCKEGCGATPLTLAVLNADTKMCQILLENYANYDGPLFGSFPAPVDMAVAMDLKEIVALFNSYSKKKENPIIKELLRDTATINKVSNPLSGEITVQMSSSSTSSFQYTRSMNQGFPTAVVGDVGTCKINRGVKHRNNTKFGWMTEIPGDLHAKGHLCEAVFKAHGKGGFHKIVHDIMNRKNLKKDVFKKRKFQEQNLNSIKEAVRDASHAYGIAAVIEFKASDNFPSNEELSSSLRKHGNHTSILLNSFKLWLEKCGKDDEAHRYHQQMFTLFGPLLDMFVTSGKQGDGLLRETVWVLLLPIFAQLNFRNYWTEAFVHVSNFTSLWPLAFRRMIQKNMSVNMSGKQGHNIDLDEYVETYLVRPLKNYTTGK